MSSADFLDQWFERTCSRRRCPRPIIARFSAFARPALPTFSSITHGPKSTAHSVLGFSAARYRSHFERHRGAAREAASRFAPKRQSENILVSMPARRRRPAIPAKNSLPRRSPRAWTRISPSKNSLEPSEPSRRFLEGVRRYRSPRLFREKSISPSTRFRISNVSWPSARTFVGPSPFLQMEYMERAYDDAKYGHYSAVLTLIWSFPALPTQLAPPGKHVPLPASCSTHLTNSPEGNWTIRRKPSATTFINTVANTRPNIKDIIIGRQVLTPSISSANSAHARQHFQGELFSRAVFFLRPSRMAYYARPFTPYLCGSATASRRRHHGRHGRIASQVILKEWSHSLCVRTYKVRFFGLRCCCAKAAN